MATNGITTKQKRAIAALLTESTVAAAAETAGVGDRTLQRWINEDERFDAALTAAEGKLIDNVGRRLIKGQMRALDVLSNIMETGSETNQRLSAVSWLDHVLRVREINSFEGRLQKLEVLLETLKAG